jgi:sodium transport system permease protein
MGQAASLGTALVVFALIPAICEELAFRGFILSGLEREHRTRSAILLSALMFGFLHVLLSLFQQLFNATLLGIVLGLLAVRSQSILPGILFHFVNNALAVALGSFGDRSAGGSLAGWLYRDPAQGLYHGAWIVASVLLSGCLLYGLWKRKGEPPAREAGPGP